MITRMYWFLSGVFVVAIVLAFLAFPFVYPATVSAAGDVEQCEVFAKIGAVPVYRCVDPEYGTLCYINLQAAGVFACIVY